MSSEAGFHRSGRDSFLTDRRDTVCLYRTLEYDSSAGDIYVPVTDENGAITGRHVAWHFDGERFVRQGERDH